MKRLLSCPLLFSFILILGLPGCKKTEGDHGGKKTERIVFEQVSLTDDLGALFTKTVYGTETGEKEASNIIRVEFYSISESTSPKAEFKPQSSGVGFYSKEIISPDKKWVVLRTGGAEGFLFCRTEDLMQSVRSNYFAGRFTLEHLKQDPEGIRPLVDYLRWEEPSTFVFYDVFRESTKTPDPKTDVYKLNLETGEFILPESPHPVLTPKLYKNVDNTSERGVSEKFGQNG